MKCDLCGKEFSSDEPERDVCLLCEARATREHAPELIADDDWCEDCDAPLGMGECVFCYATAHAGGNP